MEYRQNIVSLNVCVACVRERRGCLWLMPVMISCGGQFDRPCFVVNTHASIQSRSTGLAGKSRQLLGSLSSYNDENLHHKHSQIVQKIIVLVVPVSFTSSIDLSADVNGIGQFWMLSLFSFDFNGITQCHLSLLTIECLFNRLCGLKNIKPALLAIC